MKQISPSPSLIKRGTFFALTLILANKKNAPPFSKGRLGGISAFLTIFVKYQQTLKVSALLRQFSCYNQIVAPVPRLFDDYRIVSPLVTLLTQGRKKSDCALALLLCPTRIKFSLTYPPCLSMMHTLVGFFCLKFAISHP